MKSNYQMIVAFNDWMPKSHGWITEDESKQINENFKIKERTDVELQNLRDFVVMYYSREAYNAYDTHEVEKYCNIMDKMSAITAVIDAEKMNRGLGV